MRAAVDDPDDPRIAEFVGPAGPRAGGAADRGRRGCRPTGCSSPRATSWSSGRCGPASGRGRRWSTPPAPTRCRPASTTAPRPVYGASPAVLRRITGLGVHRGVLASFDRRPVAAAADVLAAARRVIVLERVSNPTNLGVIIRSAAGLGIDAVLLDPTCTDPLYRRVARVAMGEGYAFPWAWLPRLPDGGLDVVRERRVPAAGAHPRPAGDADRRRASSGPTSGSPCCSAPRARGCRPRRWRPPTTGSASPCGAGSTRSTSAWPPASPAGCSAAADARARRPARGGAGTRRRSGCRGRSGRGT